MVTANVCVLPVFLCIIIVIRGQEITDTLVLVHTIFRHGDRTPDTLNLFASSPYYNESYYTPFGYGQLTNKGKLTSYKVGTALRERYNDFLDETYNINLIEPRSSDFNRTKASLEVMLAGLFPPTKDLVWLEGFNWQPISFSYVERQYDKELFCYGCPNWEDVINEYLISDEGKAVTNKYNETFKYISEKTGENIAEILSVYYMYFGFLIQEELGLTLPEWTKNVYPDPMRSVAVDYYNIMFKSPDLRKMSGGYLLKKIISDTENKINGSSPQIKMHIYCGHENNMAATLEILNLWDGEEIPVYGSYILLELHNINNVYGFKLFYQNYTTSEPRLLKVAPCEEFCPFEQFVSIIDSSIPKDDSICGTASSSTSINNFRIPFWYFILVLNLVNFLANSYV